MGDSIERLRKTYGDLIAHEATEPNQQGGEVVRVHTLFVVLQ